jgi:hypothetical protein
MRFTAVLRAPSRAKVRREDPPLIVQNFPSVIGPLTITFRTRYDAEEFGAAIPRELWVEAQGEAPSLDDGVNAAWGVASSILPVIALTANAAIEDLQPHLAFETTAGVEDRAYFQSTVASERGLPGPAHRVPIDATVATLSAVSRSGSKKTADRLMRAAGQYGIALRYWKRHYELLCVEHLFIAAETLKVIALRQALAASGMTLDQMASTWGIRPADSRTQSLMEAEARKRIVFHGDDATELAAAKISNGFEHGYTELGELHDPALKIRDAAGHHVRQAFLELAGVPADAQRELVTERYKAPVDMTEYVRYIRGGLVGPGEELAAADQAYPILEWTSAPTLEDLGEGRSRVSGDESFTVRTADSISFRLDRFEMWGPQGVAGSDPPETYANESDESADR